MARKVKCLYCTKQGDTDTFHKEVIKDKNRYFCNSVEYDIYVLNERRKKEITEQRNELITWIVEEYYNYEVGMVFPTTLSKRLTPLFNFYPIHIVKEAFVANHDVLYWAVNNKDFANEFGMTCYIMKIVESNINDVYNKYKKEQKQVDKVKSNVKDLDLSFINLEMPSQIKDKKEENTKGISRFLSLDDM